MNDIDQTVEPVDETSPAPEPKPEPAPRYRWLDAAETKVIDYETLEPMPAAQVSDGEPVLPYDADETAWFTGMVKRRRGEAALRRAERKLAAESAPLTDSELEAVASVVEFDAWTTGATYAAGKRLTHDSQLYEVIQPVTAQAHQPPDAEGMLAIYRPVDGAVGTMDEPKRFIMGMDVVAGCHYRYNGEVWRALMSFLAHAGRQPGAPNLAAFWQQAG